MDMIIKGWLAARSVFSETEAKYSKQKTIFRCAGAASTTLPFYTYAQKSTKHCL